MYLSRYRNFQPSGDEALKPCIAGKGKDHSKQMVWEVFPEKPIVGMGMTVHVPPKFDQVCLSLEKYSSDHAIDRLRHIDKRHSACGSFATICWEFPLEPQALCYHSNHWESVSVVRSICMSATPCASCLLPIVALCKRCIMPASRCELRVMLGMRASLFEGRQDDADVQTS